VYAKALAGWAASSKNFKGTEISTTSMSDEKRSKYLISVVARALYTVTFPVALQTSTQDLNLPASSDPKKINMPDVALAYKDKLGMSPAWTTARKLIPYESEKALHRLPQLTRDKVMSVKVDRHSDADRALLLLLVGVISGEFGDDEDFREKCRHLMDHPTNNKTLPVLELDTSPSEANSSFAGSLEQFLQDVWAIFCENAKVMREPLRSTKPFKGKGGPRGAKRSRVVKSTKEKNVRGKKPKPVKRDEEEDDGDEERDEEEEGDGDEEEEDDDEDEDDEEEDEDGDEDEDEEDDEEEEEDEDEPRGRRKHSKKRARSDSE